MGHTYPLCNLASILGGKLLETGVGPIFTVAQGLNASTIPVTTNACGLVMNLLVLNMDELCYWKLFHTSDRPSRVPA